MSDDYHWHRDPAELVDARLTHAEAEALASYRFARESATDHDGRSSIVVVVPFSRQLLGDDAEAVDRVEAEVHRAVVAALFRSRL